MPDQMNPFQILQSLSEMGRTSMQNAATAQQMQLNQVNIENAQKQQAARTAFGEIAAASPDLPSAMSAAEKHPLIASFGIDVLNMGRSIMAQQAEAARQSALTAQTQQAMSIEGSKFATDSARTLGTSLGQAYQNPAQLQTVLTNHLAMVAPAFQGAIKNAGQSMISGITAGLPADHNTWTDAQKDTYSKNLLAVVAANGGDTDKIIGAAGGLPPQVVAGQTPGGAPTRAIVNSYGSGRPLTETPVSTGQPTLAQHVATDQAASLASMGNQVAQDVKGIYSMAQNLETLQKSMQDFAPGPGADTRGQLAHVGKAMYDFMTDMGVKFENPDKIQGLIEKINKGKLSASDTFTTLVAQMALANMKDSTGTSKVMQAEVETFLNAASKTTNPDALHTLIDNSMLALTRKLDKAQKFNLFYKNYTADPKFASQYPEPQAGFNTWYSDNKYDKAIGKGSTPWIRLSPKTGD